MNVILTNTGAVPVPIGSTQDKGWVNALDPGVPYPVDSEAQTIVTIGDSPGLREGLAKFFEELGELLTKLVTFWRDRHDAKRNDEGDLVVSLTIENRGTNALRVILGNPIGDVYCQPGETGVYTAPLYIEVRELGV